MSNDIIGDYVNHVFYSNQCVFPPGVDPLCYCRTVRLGASRALVLISRFLPQANDSAPFPNIDLTKTTFEVRCPFGVPFCNFDATRAHYS